MSTSPGDADAPQALTYEELADLQAGLLDVEQEEELRARMRNDPSQTTRMLGALAQVDRIFPDPDEPSGKQDVPPQVAARWQRAIAEEDERRALGCPSPSAETTHVEDRGTDR